MSEWRLFDEGTVPEHTTAEWYAGRENAPHLEQEGHRQRIQQAAQFCRIVMTVADVREVCDLGAGDGGMLSLLADIGGAHLWGYDLAPAAVAAAAERGVNVEQADITADEVFVGEGIVVATELLEHMVDPHGLLRQLHGAGPRYLVASSPWNETPDSHYEFHVWAWDVPGYAQLLQDAGWRPHMMNALGSTQLWLAVRA